MSKDNVFIMYHTQMCLVFYPKKDCFAEYDVMNWIFNSGSMKKHITYTVVSTGRHVDIQIYK